MIPAYTAKNLSWYKFVWIIQLQMKCTSPPNENFVLKFVSDLNMSLSEMFNQSIY